MLSPVGSVLITASLVWALNVCCAQAERLEEADEAFWQSLLNPDLSRLSEEEQIRFLLENGRYEDDAVGGGADLDFSHSQRQGANEERLRFPKLSSRQRQFAVNPDFRSFSDPSFKQQEGISDRAADSEFVDDSLLLDRDNQHKNSKKASEDPFGPGSSFSEKERIEDMYFTTIVAVSSALAVFAIVGAGFCYHRVRRNSKASEDVEYPAYGVTGPGAKENSPTAGTDRKLAQNAQMYHYQHQKQQMIAFDSASPVDKRVGGSLSLAGNGSDCESDDGEEGDYTVYECPGLAPTGEMEVHNPLFQEQDTTPKANK